MKKFSFTAPTNLQFGSNYFDKVGELIGPLGKHALLVTSRSSMDRMGYTRHLIDDLKRQDIAVTSFKDIQLGPTIHDVDRGATLARNEGVDFVIAMGGGSPIDCAKAIAGVAPGNRPTKDYLYQRETVRDNALPVVAIPTTAGTGSEVNKAAIVTDPEQRFKDGIRSYHLFPRIAIVDPTLSHSVDRQTTAHTGFDVMAHAIESYVSPKAQPLSDAFALLAIKHVIRFLPVVLDSPQDANAREQLMLASTAMGFNLSSVGSCFPHRADKALCAHHTEIPHGQSIAMFYPHWIKSCYMGSVERFANVAAIIQPETSRLTERERAGALAGIIEGFIDGIGLGKKMKDFGVTREEIPKLAQSVAGDLSVNPIPVKTENLESIFAEILSAS